MLYGPLYCEQRGDPSQPPLFLLHGGGASRWVWSGVLEHLSGEFNVFLPDLLEHGRSGGTFSVRGSADQIAGLLEHLAVGPVHLAGLSIGAQVGLELAGRFPHLVSSAFVSGPIMHCPPWLEWARDPHHAAFARAVFACYMPIRAFPPLTWLHTVLLRIPPRHRPDYFADVRRETADGFARMAREYLAWQPPEALWRSSVPTLLSTGPLELPEVKRTVDELALALPQAESVTVPALEHNWLLENPELFARTIRLWSLERATPPELSLREA